MVGNIDAREELSAVKLIEQTKGFKSLAKLGIELEKQKTTLMKK